MKSLYLWFALQHQPAMQVITPQPPPYWTPCKTCFDPAYRPKGPIKPRVYRSNGVRK